MGPAASRRWGIETDERAELDMNEAGFREWLEANYKPNTVSTKLSEARRLDAAYGDLDRLYDQDRLDSVARSLAYSTKNRAEGKPNPSKLELTGDPYVALSGMVTAVNFYRNFREGVSRTGRSQRPDLAAVNKAMDECDALGVDAFLRSHGFDPAITYWAVRDGKQYPSKAIFGVAYGFMPGGEALGPRDCNGTDARKHLEKLGFEIVGNLSGTAVDPDEGDTAAAASATAEARNIILHGPPGTGKTYATARVAVDLCNGAAPEDRRALMEAYQALHRKGRIGFVTFHQSFAYEEFVEGLRPVVGEDGEDGSAAGTGFSLKPQDGIFKQIAKLAAENHGPAMRADAPLVDRGRKIFKMSLGRSWAAEDDAIYQDAIRDGYVVLGWGGDVDWSDPRFGKPEAIKERWRQDHPDAGSNDPNIAQMCTFRIYMDVGCLVVISDGNRKFRAIGEITGPYRFQPDPGGEYNHRRPVKWLWHSDESLPRERIYGKVLSQVSTYQLNSRYVDWDALEQIVATGGDVGATTGVPEPYVLIIDEINRANISKVFGELITLLEPDKRIGAENELRVKLPYSGELFGVPANLHIVGTMNTADRSIALLDTALRRRFIFEELMPDPAVLPAEVDGVPLRALLSALNERIEYLFDREHQIGHAYFIGCSSRAEIDARMRHRVIPLLAEYFYEDWNKVAAVLGDAKGERFLERRELRAPAGLDADGDTPVRWRWSLRERFAADAYVGFS